MVGKDKNTGQGGGAKVSLDKYYNTIIKKKVTFMFGVRVFRILTTLT